MISWKRYVRLLTMRKIVGVRRTYWIHLASYLPTTGLATGHVTALTTAAGKSVDLSRFKVRPCSPLPLAHWLFSVTCVMLPRSWWAGGSGGSLKETCIVSSQSPEVARCRVKASAPGQFKNLLACQMFDACAVPKIILQRKIQKGVESFT